MKFLLMWSAHLSSVMVIVRSFVAKLWVALVVNLDEVVQVVEYPPRDPEAALVRRAHQENVLVPGYCRHMIHLDKL